MLDEDQYREWLWDMFLIEHPVPDQLILDSDGCFIRVKATDIQ